MPGDATVYIDMLFLVNFLLDFIVLWATARLAQIRVSPWRLAGGACLGALYSVLVLLPGLERLSTFELKFLVSLVMLLSVFAPVSWKKFGQALLFFYLVAFTMGGAVFGFVYFITGSNISKALGSFTMDYLWLIVAVITAGLLGKYGMPYLKKSLLQDLLKVPLEITVQGRQLKIYGLVDTGNQLVDPVTGMPVIIVEYSVLSPLLPPQLKELVSGGGEFNLSKLADVVPEEGTVPPFRVIPFTTIGKRHGLLIGFRPDEVTVYVGDRKIRKRDVIIGIYNMRLSPRGTYRALLHPDLLQAAAN